MQTVSDNSGIELRSPPRIQLDLKALGKIENLVDSIRLARHDISFGELCGPGPSACDACIRESELLAVHVLSFVGKRLAGVPDSSGVFNKMWSEVFSELRKSRGGSNGKTDTAH